MKKSKLPSFLIPCLLFFASLVRAGPVEGVEQLLGGLGQVIVIIIQFVSDTILDINSFDEFLFAKLVFFILISLVIYVTIDKNNFFGENKTIVKIITLTISILAVRFIPDELIQVVFLQYSTLGAAIGMFIPFIIMLFFLHQSEFGPLPRKIGWFIYGVSYLAIFSYTYIDLTGMAGYIYWTGIAGIVIAFFFDRQIHAAFGSISLQQAKRGFESQRYADIQTRIDNISTQLSSGNLPHSVRINLEKRKAYFEKELLKIMKSL